MGISSQKWCKILKLGQYEQFNSTVDSLEHTVVFYPSSLTLNTVERWVESFLVTFVQSFLTMKVIFKGTWLLCTVKCRRKCSARNATVYSRRKLIWKHTLKVCTVRALQSLSVTLVRSRFQTPAILKDTSPLPRIQVLTNHRKQYARDLQRQHVLQPTSGESLQVRIFQVVLEKFESVVMILPV